MPHALQPLSGKVVLICGAGADQARLAAELLNRAPDAVRVHFSGPAQE